MNTKRVSVCSILGLGCLLLTQLSCSAQQKKPVPNKQLVAQSQLPQQKAQPTQKETPAPKPTASTRQVTFKNDITKPMLAYTYLFIKYSPSLLTVSVNGQQIDPGQEKTITVTDNKIMVQYHFEFSTHRSGTRTIEYTVDKTATKTSFTFNWKKKIRIAIDGATPVGNQEKIVA